MNISTIASVIRTVFNGTEAVYPDAADGQVLFRVMLDNRSIDYIIENVRMKMIRFRLAGSNK